MKALVYDGPGRRAWRDVPDPDPADTTDAIVRVDAVTICGTDLHILKGDVPEVAEGRILGHEAVGTVVEAGSAVRGTHAGDRVLISCITACGRCGYCRQGRYGQCQGGGGWILGHLIDGTQAEYVRVPFADTSTHKPATLHLEDLWIKDVTITTGLVDTRSTPTLLKMTAAGRFDTSAFITHRYGLDEMQDAYGVFSRADETGALKVALFRH